MDPTNPKRITMILKNPNPLYEKWLKEYMDEAEQKGAMKQYNALNYALINLKKYKLPLKSTRECRILKGFTENICVMLNEKQTAYNLECQAPANENNINNEMCGNPLVSTTKSDDVICLDSDSDDEIKHKLLQSPTISSKDNTSVKKDLVDVIKMPSCLLQKSVKSTSNKNLKRHASSSSCSSQPKSFKKYSSFSLMKSSKSSVEEVEYFVMGPREFDVILYVDTGEVVGGNTKVEDDPMLRELQKSGIYYEVKDLKVGDYLWICRDKILKNELVLPHIIERKRIDDFAKSIKDGRYYEQKNRLKKSGIQYITYLIEECNISRVGLPQASLDQARDNTAIRDGLYVKVTKNIQHTARYLVDVTSLLQEEYLSKTLASCHKENLVKISNGDDLVSLMTFQEFNQSSIKNKPSKISERFVRMLLQINQMTLDKALGIVEKYPTPILLQKAFETEYTDREKLLAMIPGKFSNQVLGPTLSKIVSDLFK